GGWTVEVQSGQYSSDRMTTVELFNVIATRPEWADSEIRPLVLSTHYDSCPFGPGAGDAGGCVATLLEAGRLLMSESQAPQRPLILVFTDGEELGLRGAEQLVASHPLSQRRPLFLNLDARGTCGPVLMYETHDGNLTAVQQWISQLAYPQITGSLFSALYRYLPNGTDFTVFRDAGWEGFNFAILDGAHRYHQPDDTLENLDPRSVQHFGNHVVNLAGTILSTSADPEFTDRNAVFFDVLGVTVIRFPTDWCLPMAFAVTLLAWRHRRTQPDDHFLRALLTITGAMLLIMIVVAAFGWMMSASVRGTRLLERPFVAHGHWLCLALSLLSIAMTLSMAAGLFRRMQPQVIWTSLRLINAGMCLTAAILLPEFFHLVLIPAIVTAVAERMAESIDARCLMLSIGMSFTGVPLLHLLSMALGPGAGLILSVAYASSVIPLFPVLGQGREKISVGNVQAA
ncbi:MAG: M28 family peptidase, partial [Planctomycetaceae bacterium]|nr:M28 family peptidase [Planctomycetaceae bacterium]